MISLEEMREAEAGVGIRVRQLRKQAGWTQEQLAVRSGTNQAVIQKIENGKSLRPRGLADLANILRANPAWLQWGDLFASPDMPDGVSASERQGVIGAV